MYHAMRVNHLSYSTTAASRRDDEFSELTSPLARAGLPLEALRSESQAQFKGARRRQPSRYRPFW